MQTSKYLIANANDLKWGLAVSTVGYEEIAPGEKYPTKGHASGYYFNIQKGRILNEYQILYITEGEGTFTSAHIKDKPLMAGNAFLLFPGEWHTYHPVKDKGWKCYWIGFKGRNMDERVKAGFLKPDEPIFVIGYNYDIDHYFNTAMEVARKESAYAQQFLAGIVNLMLGVIYYARGYMKLGKNKIEAEMMEKARMILTHNIETAQTIHEVAETLGLSYSKFRKLFKLHTGIPPALYQHQLRLIRAKELLTSTDLSIKEIAYKLHFETSDYFSSTFKKNTGLTPSEFRKLMI